MTEHLRYAVVETTIGALDVVVDQGSEGHDVVVGIYFPGHWTRPDRALWGRRVEPEEPIFAQTRTELEELFAGERTAFTVPIELRGTPFQRAVWDVLLTIPPGRTVTYGDVAARVGSRNAQLVGQAVGHNPISIIVPCHRVVGSQGTLTGYAGGVDRKAWLLEVEGALPVTLFAEVPTFGQR
ncbi:methylated-DNA--[protein]-cysteine S-methyltransferase [Mariniluteicoccus flavus]